MNVVFVADFFSEHILGGAESNDSVLISFLEKEGFLITKKQSSKCTLQFLKEYRNSCFVISNFVALTPACKKYLVENLDYIIYEHDHKYCTTRDPSKFKNFSIPTKNLINVEFYKNARKVFVLSEICSIILKENLNLTNVVNIGTSLWSGERLDLIEQKSNNQKNKKLSIIRSNNPIKGTTQAVNYCKSKNIEHDFILPAPEEEFLQQISETEEILFLPQVLETFCRVVAEARMMNCKIKTTPKLIGFFSETDLASLSGEELIEAIRKRTQSACVAFKEAINDANLDKVTVILNCYRRPEYLREQIQSLRSQTIAPTEIWLWVNHHEDNEKFDFSELNVERVFKNDHNWKYFGRFAAAMLAKTEYVAFFDDDTIPGKRWLENCLKSMKKQEGIYGGAGVVLNSGAYTGHTRYGWSSKNEEIVEVDLVGHAWFFKRAWLKYMWMEDPLTWDNGEDIHFAYTAQKYGNISSFCPPHPADQLDFHSSLKGYEYGVDARASSASRNHNVFYEERNEAVKYSIKNGWKPIRTREK